MLAPYVKRKKPVWTSPISIENSSVMAVYENYK